MSNENIPEKLNVTVPIKPKLNVIGMLNPFLGWIVSHWKLVLFLVLVLFSYVEYKIIQHYKTEIATEQTSINSYKDAVKVLNNAIADQDKKVVAANKESLDKQKQLDNLQASLKGKAIIDQKKLDDLRKRPVGNTCDDALNYLNDFIGTVKWQK